MYGKPQHYATIFGLAADIERDFISQRTCDSFLA
jgi:hypothetical protein